MSWVEGASIPENFLTGRPEFYTSSLRFATNETPFQAFQALVLCSGLKKGDNVLIHAGASGVGTAAIQLSRLYGAYVSNCWFSLDAHYEHKCSKTVIATASSKEKLDGLLAMQNGATHVVNYKTQDFSAEVKKITEGKGVDVIIDFVAQSHWNKNIDSLALDGRMTMLGALSG